MPELAGQRIPVASSVLASVAYWPDTILQIEFRSGEVYRYTQVPSEIYQALLAAESKGSYFNRFIRDRFPTQRLDSSSTSQ